MCWRRRMPEIRKSKARSDSDPVPFTGGGPGQFLPNLTDFAMARRARRDYIRRMHILLAALAILSAVGFWAWRLHMARRGLEEIADLTRTVANAPRRLAFRYKAGKSGISLIEDPREAAAIMMMMVALARGGPLSPRQGEMVETEIQTHFRMTAPEAEELAAHAAWVNSVHMLGAEEMRQMSRLVVNAPHLGPKEVVDLDAMLVAVSEAEGLPTRAQLALLQIYRDMAGLKT